MNTKVTIAAGVHDMPTLQDGDREELGEPDEARDHAAALVAEARGDEAGMQAIGGDPRAMQAAGEFAREKNVAKLGAT
jgi:hypothetical protein